MTADRFEIDALVIGAGVVGLACARELATRGHSVVVLERHEGFGVETSSRNSEVVHAGIYYPPSSLKATLCARGNRSLYAWCEARDVPYSRLGKLIVAASEEDEPKLDDIVTRACANGVQSLERLPPRDIRRLEPHVRATAALWSPTTGIVDSHALMGSLLLDLERADGTVVWHHQLLIAEPLGRGYACVARSERGEESRFTARWVVNSAGLEADRVAALPGLDVEACGYRHHYARGHYFRVNPRKAHLASHLIYPTPVPGGLGIHVTLDLAGGIRLGPDVEYLAQRDQDYTIDERLAATFHHAVSRYLEGLELEDLAPDLAGIRPKLQAPGGPFRDFVIAEESPRGLPGWMNLLGIESPGLTCSLEIATMTADLLAAADT